MAMSEKHAFATDREDPVYVNDRAHLGIARTIPISLPEAMHACNELRTGADPVRAITLDNGGMLLLRLPLRADLTWPQRRYDLLPARTNGKLFTRTNRAIAPVEIELSPWSADISELIVRPAVRAPGAWSARRLQRWFTHGHLAADALRATLSVPLPPAPAEEPLDLTDTNRARVA
jgi:hypothetical protein